MTYGSVHIVNGLDDFAKELVVGLVVIHKSD